MKNETLDILRTQRCVHWDFSDRPVRREDIETIVQSALYTANNADRLDISVVVVEDPEVLTQLSGGENEGYAPPTLFFLLDYTKVRECARRMGYPDYRSGDRLYHFLFGMFDINAAAQSAVIAARALGLRTLVTNFVQRKDVKAVQRALKLPEKYCFPVIQVALGYAKEEPAPRPAFPLEQALHFGTYRPFSDADFEAVNAYMDAAYKDLVNPRVTKGQYPHALDWYFQEWWIEHYSEETYAGLAKVLMESGLLQEPGLCPKP